MNNPHSWQTLYVMAAKGIQSFILQGDKLRLMIGGSELVEALPDDLVVRTLSELGAAKDEYKVLTSSAGGIRILFRNRDWPERLAKLLPCAITLYAPGLA